MSGKSGKIRSATEKARAYSEKLATRDRTEQATAASKRYVEKLKEKSNE